MIAANSLLDKDSVIFAALPLFHVNALLVTLLAPLFRGQSVVRAGPLGYRDRAAYAELWNIVAPHRIAAMSAVPTVYATPAQYPVRADISSPRHCHGRCVAVAADGPGGLPGAHPCHSRRGVRPHGSHLRDGPQLPRRPAAVGQRMSYHRVAVVRVGEDGTWERLPAGETGALVIGGPTVFAGYVTGHDERTLDPAADPREVDTILGRCAIRCEVAVR